MCTDYVAYRGDAHGEIPRQDHTTGRSEAIRFDKVLFKSLPAFRQRAGFRAHVLGPHTVLVTLDEPPAEAPFDEADVIR